MAAKQPDRHDDHQDQLHRRRFLQVSGAAAGAAALWVAGCDDDDDNNRFDRDAGADANGRRDAGDVGDVGNGPDTADGRGGADATDAGGQVVLDFSQDVGVLNYAYALEQLEAAFYAMVVANSFNSAITDSGEQEVLRDISDHETVHRDFYAQALGDAAIGALSVDFSGVDFDDRASVLGTAQTFEDLGVAAYNGAGTLLSMPDFLTAAGKIVSVEGRHAAVIRDLMDPSENFFGGTPGGTSVIDAQGLDRALSPTDVLAAAGDFIATPIMTSGLPSGM